MNEEGAQSLGTATTGRPAATAAKSCGEWKIVCLHLSSNVFTNTLIAELTRTFWYAGGAALLIGGLAGWFLGRRRAKRSRG